MRLIIEDLEGATTVVNLGNDEVTIGRKPHNTIQLTEQNVSRSHAKLLFEEDGWVIQDLGSYNGVRVNGVPINGPTLLRESDLIQIGDYHLTLTDDVDRETVDIERPRVAANDHYMGSASASSELPSVSVDDLSPMRPSSMAPGDSAAYRSEPIHEDQEKSKAGLILGIVGAVLGVVAIGILAVKLGGSDETPGPEKVVNKPEAPSKQDPELPSDSGAVADGGAGSVGEVVATDGGTVEAEEAGAVEDDDDSSPTDGGGELVETDGGSEPPEPTTPKQPKPKNPTQPKQPAEPKLPPDQALAEARKASLTGDNKRAYALAKDAYDQNKSSDALSVMGVAACKMGSESKAKAAYKKMTEQGKAQLEKICQPLGIELK